MRHLVRHAIILLAITALAVWAIVPPEKKLRRGKDLAGGASITYHVDVKPTDPADTLNKVITVVKDRLDPNGVMDLLIVAQGSNRIEITMPLPSERVKELRGAYDAHVATLAGSRVSHEELTRILQSPKDQRDAAFKRLAGTDAARLSRFEAAARAQDDYAPARAKFDDAQKALAEIKRQIQNAEAKSTGSDPLLEQLRTAQVAADKAVKAEAANVAPLAVTLDDAIASAVSGGFNSAELTRSLSLPTTRVRIPGKDNKVREIPSPRERALQEIHSKHADLKPAIEKAVNLWTAYESERRGLDDPQDVVRILRGAGVLSFRITVDPGAYPQEAEARTQLKAGGPRSVRVEDARWYKVNKIESWVSTEEQLAAFEKSPAGFFQGMGYIAEEYKGEFYILCYDTRGMRLTSDDGSWTVAGAFQGVDPLGRPAIDFRMDALGANRLGALTENNVGKRMAVLLDDQVYTAPTLQSRISNSGQITGNFSSAEREYIIRVLSAGSLKAKLDTEPISTNIVGPQLGADNLRKGAEAGIAAFVIVGIFMIGYYFACGFVSMLALAFNTLLIVGAMSLNQAAFTLPGIAGIILTFGQAVDANVLVYERMREEFRRGADLRTAVRLGYSRAMSAIIDGNVTTMIICIVLGFTGTQEVKGFALTLGIGTATTLFAQLYATRVLFTFLVEKIGWRKVSMLPMLNNNWLGNRLIPNIDWMGIRFVSYTITTLLMVMGIGFLVLQGKELLGTEFRGGTSVTVQFKDKGPDGKPIFMKRNEVEELVKGIADGKSENDPLSQLKYAEVIAVNPQRDNVTSNQFTIKTLVKSPEFVLSPVTQVFGDRIESRPALTFTNSDQAAASNPSIFPITAPTLGDSISRPTVRTPAGEFYGGVAFVLENIQPGVSRADLESRMSLARGKPDAAEVAGRPVNIVVLEGDDSRVTAAAVLVRDPELSYFSDETAWRSELRDREWKLLTSALTQSQTLASVQSFSAAVASSFANQAMVSVALASLMVIIYIWLRFNSIRFSIAAILTTLHDCICCIGFVAVATWLFNNAHGLASTFGILPFKIDLNVMTAIMTTLGFSLNDTIIVMDRIRENRGKQPYVSRKVINDSINQTISRTLITSGTTFIAVITLYIWGGEGIRVFSYTMLIGVIIGTYSSIAVAAPLVWDHRLEKHGHEPNSPDPVSPAPSAA